MRCGWQQQYCSQSTLPLREGGLEIILTAYLVEFLIKDPEPALPLRLSLLCLLAPQPFLSQREFELFSVCLYFCEFEFQSLDDEGELIDRGLTLLDLLLELQVDLVLLLPLQALSLCCCQLCPPGDALELLHQPLHARFKPFLLLADRERGIREEGGDCFCASLHELLGEFAERSVAGPQEFVLPDKSLRVLASLDIIKCRHFSKTIQLTTCPNLQRRSQIHLGVYGFFFPPIFGVMANLFELNLTILISKLQFPYRRKIMLSYSSKARPILEVLQKTTSGKENNTGCSTPDYKRAAFRPANLEISKKSSYIGPTYEAALTPKTSRTTYNPSSTLNGSFSRSPGLTPDKQRVKKELSFLQSKPETVQIEREESIKRVEFRPVDNERPRKVTKTVMFRDPQEKEEDNLDRLRQTVSNANSWLNRNNMPPKPVKSQVEFEPGDSARTDRSMRRKIESEYLPASKVQPLQETVPSSALAPAGMKFTPRSHIRTRTTFEESEAQPTKGKQQSQHATPRISQEKLTRSVNLKLNNPMNKTDPSGSYFQRGPAKRLSSTLAPRERPISLEDFQLMPCKGEGRFGKVFPARHKKSGFLLAIKQVKKESVRLMLDQFVQELKISLFLSHSNVIKFYGFFHDALNFYILMEYMEEGSLYALVKAAKGKRMPEEEAAVKLGEVCQAVAYLHSLDILHRDIKPENIVLSHGVCKLCDFGWAAYSRERRSTYCGTLDYVCPEILQGESYDNFVDIWAIGVLAFEMLTGKAPFYHISRQETMKSIVKCDFGFPEDMSLQAKGFIAKTLQRSPGMRVTIEQLLKDRFLADGLRGFE